VGKTKGDRDPGALIAADAADYQDLIGTVEVSRLDGIDRAAICGAAELDGPKTDWVWPAAEGIACDHG
jgi:hypothetical protein